MAALRFIFPFFIAASLGQSSSAFPLQQHTQAEAREDDVALLLKLGKGVSQIEATDFRGKKLIIPDPEKKTRDRGGFPRFPVPDLQSFRP